MFTCIGNKTKTTDNVCKSQLKWLKVYVCRIIANIVICTCYSPSRSRNLTHIDNVYPKTRTIILKLHNTQFNRCVLVVLTVKHYNYV